MSWNHGLPLLPGNTFRDTTKSDFHLPHTLDFKNGYALRHRPWVGIGQDPLLSEQLIQQIRELSFEIIDSTYGSYYQSPAEDFIPAHVALDKKVLRFYGYFRESILYSSDEDHRVRPVVIYYYLEDDSMCIIEPRVENSGIPQGTRIKRQRLPKNQPGEHYSWKNLNLGMDLEVYSVKYHITQCDYFTKEFMQSEGLVLNDPEPMPLDLYSEYRKIPLPTFTTPSEGDRLHQFLIMDRKVLRFFALWDDSDAVSKETRHVKIMYFLADDTVEIQEIHSPNDGRDHIPVLMRRQKLAKKRKPGSYPSCVLEVSAQEVDEYFSPKDFQLGQTIKLLGRSFLLHDCDGFTKEYYQKNHPHMEMKPVEIPRKSDTPQQSKMEIPPYNNLGSLEDSLQNCLALIPKRPKKDVMKMLENCHKVLRYSARLDSMYPEDEGRRFVLSYFLYNDTISIFEKPSFNSGIMAGKYLEKKRVPKPGSTADNPQYYSPADFTIGATVNVFSHRFVLTDADQYVLMYLESISDQIPCQTLESLRLKLKGVSTSNTQLADQRGGDVAEPSS